MNTNEKNEFVQITQIAQMKKAALQRYCFFLFSFFSLFFKSIFQFDSDAL